MEGTGKESYTIAGTPEGNTKGDFDDVIAFTARSKSRPFTGMINGTKWESDVAEIIWWCAQQDENGDGTIQSNERKIYRRVLLVGSHLPAADPSTNDVSRNKDGTRANTLEDLTIRENRFAHGPTFPNKLNKASLVTKPVGTDQYGEDVAVGNVLAFDVRVFDPSANSLAGTGKGEYVDLGTGGGVFGGQPQAASKLTTPTWDTWPFQYEYDGAGPEPGTNGRDDNSNGAIDEPAERETSPPYLQPLRGIQVTIRTFDIGTKQVRQSSIKANFVPE